MGEVFLNGCIKNFLKWLGGFAYLQTFKKKTHYEPITPSRPPVHPHVRSPQPWIIFETNWQDDTSTTLAPALSALSQNTCLAINNTVFIVQGLWIRFLPSSSFSYSASVTLLVKMFFVSTDRTADSKHCRLFFSSVLQVAKVKVFLLCVFTYLNVCKWGKNYLWWAISGVLFLSIPGSHNFNFISHQLIITVTGFMVIVLKGSFLALVLQSFSLPSPFLRARLKKRMIHISPVVCAANYFSRHNYSIFKC